MNVHYPYAFDGRGRTREANDDSHVRQLVEQVLFTAPGERVMRPNFGSGVMQLVFAPNSPELANTVQFLVQGALEQWLGQLITVEAVGVTAQESTLEITVQYVVRRSQRRAVESFRRGVPSP